MKFPLLDGESQTYSRRRTTANSFTTFSFIVFSPPMIKLRHPVFSYRIIQKMLKGSSVTKATPRRLFILKMQEQFVTTRIFRLMTSNIREQRPRERDPAYSNAEPIISSPANFPGLSQSFEQVAQTQPRDVLQEDSSKVEPLSPTLLTASAYLPNLQTQAASKKSV